MLVLSLSSGLKASACEGTGLVAAALEKLASAQKRKTARMTDGLHCL